MRIFTLAFFLCITGVLSGYSQDRNATAYLDQQPVRVLKFYPNPATTIINYQFNKPVDTRYVLQVYNFLGKKIYEVSGISGSGQINLSDFTRGVYIFQLRDLNGRLIETGKFQVSK